MRRNGSLDDRVLSRMLFEFLLLNQVDMTPRAEKNYSTKPRKEMVAGLRESQPEILFIKDVGVLHQPFPSKFARAESLTLARMEPHDTDLLNGPFLLHLAVQVLYRGYDIRYFMLPYIAISEYMI